MSGQRCPNDNQIKEQIVVVTGGNSGIGFEIAKALGARGGRIILACRNMTAGERAAAIIKRELGCHTPISSDDNINPADRYFVEARELDLSSFRSVHQFASRLMAEFEHIDVLVNNAGVVFGDTRMPTADGFEQHCQVNYLAPFLLTQLLLPHLKRSEQGRIVFVSAHAHHSAKIDFDDPLNVGTWAVKFHARDAFAHSKLAVILATRWLAKELKGKLATGGSLQYPIAWWKLKTFPVLCSPCKLLKCLTRPCATAYSFLITFLISPQVPQLRSIAVRPDL